MILEKVNEKYHDTKKSTFTDLTPVDDADPCGTYTKALSFALENPRIKNIALSGPYGSGKSSIIRTFEKNSDYKFLNISLASFKEDNTDSVNATLIERSILQQMLYGADANKLPYSRFKRISTPEHPLFKSLLITAWIMAAIFLYHYRNELLLIESYSFLGLGFISLLSFVISIPVVLISDIYKASFGLSVNKLSLKNVEIETCELSESSILNRHLDEIIYFFQVTNYNVVVIEDLDRFDDPEIFVKLREINKLVNDNDKTHNQIKFLYALKDDIFGNKTRAKFFDFIIPVVPVINSSNSLDKMQKRLKEHDFAKSVDSQFLREVSFYIDDLRLIHNIFNEFVIYYELLKSEGLAVTKLLAMMIYKNVYPNDFENLHYGKGALFEVCMKKYEYLQNSKDKLKAKIENIRSSIQLADAEKIRSIRELIDMYVGHIIMHANQPVIGIISNNQNILFSQLTTFEQFEPILSEGNIHLSTHIQNHPSYRVAISKSFSQIQEEINPGETFLRRKENIENKSMSNRIELQKQIKKIENEVSYLPHFQLFELLQGGHVEIPELINGHNITDSRLLLYLIRNGYLDDNYYLYVSNFYEGRLTYNDREYILTIRDLNQPDPNQKIDTPKEVCENMREEDFGYKYVLNVTLIDYLLENNEINSKRIKLAIRYISKNFIHSEEFFTSYFIAGEHLGEFIKLVCSEWPGFSSAAISSDNGAELISYILKFPDSKFVSEYMNTGNVLTDYLSEYGDLVFASYLQVPDDYNVLKSLSVRFHDVELLEKNDALIEFIHVNCLYSINTKNVNYMLQTFTVPHGANNIKPETANYTSILASGSEVLKEYVEENLPEYIEKVLLRLPNNTEESEVAIMSLMNNEVIQDNLKKKIITKQRFVFSTFEGLSESLWPCILQEEKVTISWRNISKYLSCEDNDKEIVTELFKHPLVVDLLSTQNISGSETGEDECKLLSRFIVDNEKIKNEDYCKLIKRLPYWYQEFPVDVSKDKVYCLAKQRKVRLSEESFDFSSDDNSLTAILIGKNIDDYLDEKDKYSISDDVRELLLSGDLSNENKIIICNDVTLEGVINNEKLSLLFADFIISNEVNCSTFEDSVLSSVITNAKTSSDSIRILIKCLSTWDEEQTMAVLADLPGPLSDISLYGKTPKLSNNKFNLEFARLLKTKGFVSSIKEKEDTIKIYTFKSSDHL